MTSSHGPTTSLKIFRGKWLNIDHLIPKAKPVRQKKNDSAIAIID